MNPNQYRAVCVLTNNKPGIKGFIEFTELPNKKVTVNVNISGLTPGYHGFHIHQTGDLRQGCASLCSHFNPFNTPHGNPHSERKHRHVGDLGNVFADQKGVVSESFIDEHIKMTVSS
jgi:Cu/Zn superoxide dismutase